MELVGHGNNFGIFSKWNGLSLEDYYYYVLMILIMH